MKMIIYNDKNMACYEPTICSLNIGEECHTTYLDVLGATSIGISGITGYSKTITFTIPVSCVPTPIILDEATNKQIAKHNLSAEFAILNKQKELAELELKAIRSKIKRFKDKYDEIIKFIDSDFGADEEGWDEDDYL